MFYFLSKVKYIYTIIHIEVVADRHKSLIYLVSRPPPLPSGKMLSFFPRMPFKQNAYRKFLKFCWHPFGHIKNFIDSESKINAKVLQQFRIHKTKYVCIFLFKDSLQNNFCFSNIYSSKTAWKVKSWDLLR